MAEKLCTACRQDKPTEAFYRHYGHKDGLSTYCKDCTLADRARNWRAKHPEPAPWVMPTEKPCGKCGETKPLDQFHQRKSARDGKNSICAACSIAAATNFNKRNPAYHREQARKYRLRHPNRVADNNLSWRLGLPWGTYDKMLADQDGKCAICGNSSPGARTKRFHVDHDAATGAVRGLLCARCNTGIGQMRHSTTILASAIEYLQSNLQYSPSAEGSGARGG